MLNVQSTARPHPLVGLHGGWGRKRMNLHQSTMTQNNNKRRLVDEDSDSDSEARQMACNAGLDGAWPRFLVVEEADPDLPLGRLSPFAINKGFQAISASGFKEIKRMRTGAFLVECSTRKASDCLLKRNEKIFVDRQIKVSIHPQLNSSKGIIRCRELRDVNEAEIRTNLANQGVIKVEKALILRDGKKEPTGTIFLTFAMTRLPETITVGYMKVKVVPYIPSPLRCFRCQHYGHGSRSCKSAETCRDCGKAKHEGGCVGPKYCVNCKGPHSANSRDCPAWKTEQEIQRVKTIERCSFVEARRKVEALKPTLSKTFSEVASSPSPKTIPEPSTMKLELMLEKVVQTLSVVTANMNIIMKTLNIQAHTATLAVLPSIVPPETGQAGCLESASTAGRPRRSESHSGSAGEIGRREAAASDKVNHTSTSKNTTANSGSVVPRKKPTPAPKPKKQDKADLVGPELPTKNKFDVLTGMDMEVESAPTLGVNGKSTTSSRQNRSPRKEDKEKK